MDLHIKDGNDPRGGPGHQLMETRGPPPWTGHLLRDCYQTPALRIHMNFKEIHRGDLTSFRKFVHFYFFLGGTLKSKAQEVTVESGGNFEDYKLAHIRFLSCHLFGPVNHGQTWRGWREVVKKA